LQGRRRVADGTNVVDGLALEVHLGPRVLRLSVAEALVGVLLVLQSVNNLVGALDALLLRLVQVFPVARVVRAGVGEVLLGFLDPRRGVELLGRCGRRVGQDVEVLLLREREVCGRPVLAGLRALDCLAQVLEVAGRLLPGVVDVSLRPDHSALRRRQTALRVVHPLDGVLLSAAGVEVRVGELLLGARDGERVDRGSSAASSTAAALLAGGVGLEGSADAREGCRQGEDGAQHRREDGHDPGERRGYLQAGVGRRRRAGREGAQAADEGADRPADRRELRADRGERAD
jgi:hypothetical protein